MGQCFGSTNAKLANELKKRSHKQIELHLREDQTCLNRVFFTGSPEGIMTIFNAIDGKYKLQNIPKLLVRGYISQIKLKYNYYVPTELQALCTMYLGKIEPPNHYEFTSPTSTSTATQTLPSPSTPTPSLTSYSYSYSTSYTMMIRSQQRAAATELQLRITYHNLQCFDKNKRDYYLKWIHLLDKSLCVIFVADLSQISVQDNNSFASLCKDMEKFRRLTYFSNGKYHSKMSILVLCGLDKFHQCLTDDENQEIYRTEFEKQFLKFKCAENKYLEYSQEAVQFIKDKYQVIFEDNLGNKKKTATNKLFIRTINEIEDVAEVQRVWYKLNKALIHANIMYQLRSGGITL